MNRDVPLWPCNGHNSSDGASEVILHCNLLQPCKDKIS